MAKPRLRLVTQIKIAVIIQNIPRFSLFPPAIPRVFNSPTA